MGLPARSTVIVRMGDGQGSISPLEGEMPGRAEGGALCAEAKTLSANRQNPHPSLPDSSSNVASPRFTSIASGLGSLPRKARYASSGSTDPPLE